jgi:hypothetical protein
MFAPLRDATKRKDLLKALARWIAAVAICAPAFWQLKLVIGLYLSRVSYPFDIEWLESTVLYQAYRHMTGQSTYAPPSFGYLPMFHPPGYPILLSIVGRAVGLSYAVARSVTMSFFLLASVITVRVLVKHEGEKDRVHGVTAGALAVGLAASAAPLFEGFYDLIREDCMSWSLVMVAAALAEPKKPSLARLVAIAFVTSAAVYTRLVAVFPLVWIHLFILIRNRRAGLLLGLITISTAGLVLVGLQFASRGWFWLYCVGLVQENTVIAKRFQEGATMVLKGSPYLYGLPVVVLLLAVLSRLSARSVLWFGMVVASIPASLLPYAKVGGFANDLMPFAMLTGPAILFVVSDCARALEKHPRIGLAVRYALSAGIAVFLALKKWDKDLQRYTPTPEHWRRAHALNAMVAKLEGGAISPRHPFLAIHNGHKQPQFSDMTILDAYWGGMPGLNLGPYLDKGRARYAFLSGNEQVYTLGELASRYQYDRPLGDMPGVLIGEHSRFSHLLKWQDEEKNARVLFDFEDPDMPGWQRTGDAWEQSPTTARPRAQGVLRGVVGNRAANSYNPGRDGDRATGVMTSPSFFIDRIHLAFRIGGGGRRTYVELLVDNRPVMQQRAVYPNQELMLKVVWDVRHLQGQEAIIRLVDEDPGYWAHLLCDHFVLYD